VILRHRFGWKKASMAAALGYRPDGTAARLCFHLQQPSHNTDALSRNPVEGLWANLKDLELANRPTTLAESPTPPKRASIESARATAWSSGSWPHTGLSLDP
jgi:hypothetical protein